MPGQQYSTGTLGGYLSQPYLTTRLRSVAQPLYKLRQFVDVQEQIGKNRGDTWLFDRRGNVATQGTTLNETNTIPQTSFIIGQGTGSISEFGNSIPYTGKLSALGQIAIQPNVEQALRDDMVKTIEKACGDEFVKTEFVAVCTATDSVIFTTNGTATASAAADITAKNTRIIADYMKKKLIPKFNDSYVCVASTQSLSGMFNDTVTGGWVDISKYSAEFAKNIFNGEVGKYYNVRFVEETGYFSNAIGSSSLYGQAIFFGADNVYEAVAVPEEIRVKVSVDYGRDQGLAWYFLGGFKIVWTYATSPAEQHIVFVTSA
jgi:N4-gp56 family major capsid protein